MYIDQRKATAMEKSMPYILYLPLFVMYMIMMLFVTKFAIVWIYRLVFRK